MITGVGAPMVLDCFKEDWEVDSDVTIMLFFNQ